MHLESSEIKLTLSIENDKSFTIQPIFFSNITFVYTHNQQWVRMGINISMGGVKIHVHPIS